VGAEFKISSDKGRETSLFRAGDPVVIKLGEKKGKSYVGVRGESAHNTQKYLEGGVEEGKNPKARKDNEFATEKKNAKPD